MFEAKDRDQRFPIEQGPFGWKGFGKDPTNQTTIFIVTALINWLLVLYAFSELIVKDGRGGFDRILASPLFYLLSGVVILASAVAFWLIRYKETDARWAARFFASILPVLSIAYLIYIQFV